MLFRWPYVWKCRFINGPFEPAEQPGVELFVQGFRIERVQPRCQQAVEIKGLVVVDHPGQQVFQRQVGQDVQVGPVRLYGVDLTHQRHRAEYITVGVISVLAAVRKGQREVVGGRCEETHGRRVEPPVDLPRELGVLAPRVAVAVQLHGDKVESFHVCGLKRRCCPIESGLTIGADFVFANLKDKPQAFDLIAQTTSRAGGLLLHPESGGNLVHTASKLHGPFALVSQGLQ
ncbi:hypothetical protein NKDENANG_03343 [Candidatus Entotheonellaceae bacterium PAL068K]